MTEQTAADLSVRVCLGLLSSNALCIRETGQVWWLHPFDKHQMACAPVADPLLREMVEREIKEAPHLHSAEELAEGLDWLVLVVCGEGQKTYAECRA